MITRKDLAPLDDTSLELWRNTLKHRKDETLYALYMLSAKTSLPGFALNIIWEILAIVVKITTIARDVN